MVTRRDFLKFGIMAGAGLAVPWKLASETKAAAASANPDVFLPFVGGNDSQITAFFAQSSQLRKFIQPLRGVGAIPVMTPDTVPQPFWQPGVTHYTIDVDQYTDNLHPDLPDTHLRGFGQNGNFQHLGGIIAARRGVPVQITFRNNLPRPHFLPIDRSIMGAEDPTLDDRVDVHLHGGLVPWLSDGGPHFWWNPNGERGLSFVKTLNPAMADNEAELYYPNNQGARLVWYHDHTLGLTRLNAYAGIASAYVITDDYEDSLVTINHLPGPLDPRTIYMVFQEKIFVNSVTSVTDPTWFDVVPNSSPGDLWYAHVYDTNRYGALGPAPEGPPPDPSVVPEFFGDTILVNGTVAPFIEVEQREYRFRMLNACQARFLNPRLVFAQGSSFPASTEPKPTAAGPAFIQIGTEGGFLPAPAMVNGPKQPVLLLGPAERSDLLVDFRNVPAGSILILYSDAAGPFPMGDRRNDYFPGNSKTPSSIPGFSPNTRTLLQIRVKARVGPADPPITLPGTLTPTDPFLVTQIPGVPTPIPSGVPVRRLTLNEAFDEHGRLIQLLGTDQLPSGASVPDFGRAYDDDPTEVVQHGATEVWEILNLTGDTHPIHFHLVNVQVLSRQAFSVSQYKGGAPKLQDGSKAPDNNELGWKETVRMNPGEVTRVLMKFDLASVPFTVPESPRTGGNEFVWHCHILEHEEHDMMRPLIVI